VATSGTVWNSSTDTPASSTDWGLSSDKLTITRTGASFSTQVLAFGSTAKSSGTVIYTIVACGTEDYVGFATASETLFPGNSNTQQGISYRNDGTIRSAGGLVGTGLATWTAGDVIKCVKSGSSYSFYKNNVFQTTYDTAGDGANLTGAVYPAAADHGNLGTQITADFSGW
jgi:hypothetical protein